MNSDFSDFIRFFPIFRLFPTFRFNRPNQHQHEKIPVAAQAFVSLQPPTSLLLALSNSVSMIMRIVMMSSMMN